MIFQLENIKIQIKIHFYQAAFPSLLKYSVRYGQNVYKSIFALLDVWFRYFFCRCCTVFFTCMVNLKTVCSVCYPSWTLEFSLRKLGNCIFLAFKNDFWKMWNYYCKQLIFFLILSIFN
jgi:hypothetical protein